MKKSRLCTLLAVGLGISNLALLAFVFFLKPHHPPGEGPKKHIIAKLHLDKSQITQYEALIEKHRASISQKEKELMDQKNNLFQTLTLPEGVVNSDSIVANISQLQKDIENIHYQHFLALKRICKPDQMDDFNSLTAEISRLFRPLEKDAKPHMP